MIRSSRRWNLGMAALLSSAFVLTLSAETRKKAPVRALDLNTASAEQLRGIPGIGPGTAKAIIEFREKSGPFHRVEDLLAIRGISRARLGRIRPYVMVTPHRE